MTGSRVIRSSGMIGRDRPIPGHHVLTDPGPIGPTGFVSADMIVSGAATGPDGSDGGTTRVRRQNVKVTGPWSMFDLVDRDRVPDDRVTDTVGKLPDPRTHTEGVAWCTSCGATGSGKLALRPVDYGPDPRRTVVRTRRDYVGHDPTCRYRDGSRVVGCHVPAPIDGPRATDDPRRVVIRATDGAGNRRVPSGERVAPAGSRPDVRPDSSPDLIARGGWRVRTTAGRPDRGRVRVRRVGITGRYRLVTGSSLPGIEPLGRVGSVPTTRPVPTRVRSVPVTADHPDGTRVVPDPTAVPFWAWVDPTAGSFDHDRVMVEYLTRAAAATVAGIMSGRYDTWLSDGPAVDPVTRTRVMVDTDPTGRYVPWSVPMVTDDTTRYVGSGHWIMWSATGTMVDTVKYPVTADYSTRVPAGQDPWSDLIRDTTDVSDGPYLTGSVPDTDEHDPGPGRVRSSRSAVSVVGSSITATTRVRWIDTVPAVRLSADVSGHGYRVRDERVRSVAAGRVRSYVSMVRRITAGLDPAGPYWPVGGVHDGIDRPVRADGSARKVNRRRSRAAIIAATAVPVTTGPAVPVITTADPVTVPDMIG